MSRISLSGNLGGSGTFTVASPNSNSDRTVTLPDASGTLNTSGAANEVPAGSAGSPAIYPTGDTNTGIFFPAADTIAFSEGGVEAARFDASGNFGVGTTSPSSYGRIVAVSPDNTSTTQLVTAISANLGQSVSMTFGGLRASSGAGLGFAVNGSTTNAASIDSSGRFTLSANAAGMEINSGTYQVKSQGSGQAYMGFVSVTTALQCSFNSTSAGVSLGSAATSWGTFSDERMKDIIEPITDAANKVASLRAVIGKYKTDDEGVRRSFLIAQDVQDVLPEAVDSNISENLVLRYTEVIPLLVASIQELKAIVDAQGAEIAKLKGTA